MILHRILAASLLVLSGCATSSGPNPEVTDLRRQLLELQKTQGAQNAQIAELNNKILLLKDRVDNRTESPMNLPPPVSAAPVPVSPPAAAPELLLQTQGHENGPEKIYSQAVQDARKPQLTSLEHDVDLLLKNYKESPLTNNALYLLAETQYERGQYSQGASQFEKLYKTYPDGNKAVAALYRLGLCYEKMGHASEAKEAYQNVMTVYPGSAEALEAEKRLKQGSTPSP